MSTASGLAACGLSAVFFGSMFVPIRRYNAGDGVFVQWMMSLSILVVGFIVLSLEEFPDFHPLAMLGGALWCTGNLTAVPIIRRLGMALGMLIWNTTNCLTGWATGCFGLFGTIPRPPTNLPLNYAGLVCVIIGGVLFSRIRSSPVSKAIEGVDRVSIKLESQEKTALNGEAKEDSTEDEDVVVVKPQKNEAVQRLVGFAMALVAGVFYGLTFMPVVYMQDNQDHYSNVSERGLPYVFSHYMGIFLTSTFFFVVYAIFRKNEPVMDAQLALPSLAAGVLWGIAQSSFFYANEVLSQTVTFPIITMLPGCVATAWSVFYFKEIRGRRNFSILGIAMFITLCGAVMVGLSKSFEF